MTFWRAYTPGIWEDQLGVMRADNMLMRAESACGGNWAWTRNELGINGNWTLLAPDPQLKAFYFSNRLSAPYSVLWAWGVKNSLDSRSVKAVEWQHPICTERFEGWRGGGWEWGLSEQHHHGYFRNAGITIWEQESKLQVWPLVDQRAWEGLTTFRTHREQPHSWWLDSNAMTPNMLR